MERQAVARDFDKKEEQAPVLRGVAPQARILLADDLPMNWKILLGLFKQTMIEAELAVTGAECLQLVHERKYHMIFVDNQIADMDGVDIAKRIREETDHPNTDTPLIMQTSMSGFEAKEACRRLGFTDFLKKPVREAMLMQLLATYLPPELIVDPKEAAASMACSIQLRLQEELAAEILVAVSGKLCRRRADEILNSRYKVHAVTSGQALFAHMEGHLPDLILLERKLCDMDGLEVLRLLKGAARTAPIPVIFLTEETDQKLLVRMLRQGGSDYVTVPIEEELLLQKVGRALSQESQKQDLQQDVDQRTAELQKKNAQLERLMTQLMETLSGTIDAKDKYTNGHSKRVAGYSKKLAEKLGKPVQEQEGIYCAGLLHDIGKIGVPGSIINKTDRLTDEEYELIKTHPAVGTEILEHITEMPNLLIGARWHHERYDGRGYPDGLAGEDIPEWARIIGVADAYDAMTSRRSYRDVLPQEVVREEIEKGKGTQFDPVVADAMLAMIDADKDYHMKER